MPRFATLAEAVACVGRVYPDNGFTFQDQRGIETSYTFPEIERETALRAAALRQLGLEKGDRLAMVVIEPEDFVLVFLAALRVGVVPVPMYPPRNLGGLDSYNRTALAIVRSSAARVAVVSPEVADIFADLQRRAESLERIVAVSDVRGAHSEPVYPPIAPDDLAFLQYTSGSTMDPRGVMLTHRALLSNIDAFMGSGLEVDSRRDNGVSWLPLYHDMGLIGFVLGPLAWGSSVLFIPTSRFIRHPGVWLSAVSSRRATVTFAPTFALALTARRAASMALDGYDLSSLKAIGCGAEPIHPVRVREFVRLYSDGCRLNPAAVLPAYGLAESTLALTMKPLREPFRTRTVDRSSFVESGIARPHVDGQSSLEHVSCGRPLAGVEIQIVDQNHEPLPDDVQGQICVRGPSLGSGYFGHSEAWNAICPDGWLRTGDLGYVSHGELYVTGRLKDLIIINGRNHHPQTIEWHVAEVDGVRDGSAVAFSRPGDFGEELVVVVETRARDLERLVSDIQLAVQASVFVRPADVVCLPSGSLPKTSSGKLKRYQVRQHYMRTELRELRLGPHGRSLAGRIGHLRAANLLVGDAP